jgi:hypothetical protein
LLIAMCFRSLFFEYESDLGRRENTWRQVTAPPRQRNHLR